MECEQADRARMIVRQGDILAAHPGTPNWKNHWRRFFIVLSADCDIVNRKFDTGLVVVPVIGLKTFARDIWLPEQLRKQKAAAEKKTQELLNRFSGPPLQASACLNAGTDWLIQELQRRVAGDQDLETIASKIANLQSNFSSLVEVESSNASNPSGCLRTMVTRFCDIKSGISGNKIDPRKELKAGIAGVADPKRVDLWPICDLIGMDGQMRDDERSGFVAILRRFSFLHADLAHVEKAGWLSNPESYHRICRLRGIYKTDFLHRFANLFTRVGLDAHRDEEHERIFDQTAAGVLSTEAMS